ncbi:hypothetical protein CBR_g49288 [Chara braunii]|uniref:Inosine triphosphate pyrophosphatase n=1 Tax=Chara braunii TaxID=69332 RepID=A0A388M4J3_CHABU|nr:hypothetical protein CBR_g49288 [Chara braunii]|eukprot:GBG89497.1 hypothetical protein CBR_g49288 [Chara braunii]
MAAVTGKIVPARGPKVFGWDPVFEPEGYSQTYAEMGKDEKNKISHRGRALQKLKSFLDEGKLPGQSPLMPSSIDGER